MKHYLFYEKNHNKTIFQYKATYLWLSFAMMMSIMAVIGFITEKQLPILLVLAGLLFFPGVPIAVKNYKKAYYIQLEDMCIVCSGRINNLFRNALLVEYPIMQEEYGYEDEELDEYMPNVDDIQEFKEIMEPKRVYILDVENDGMAYLGFHFICSWDEDHDYGVMMHKERVVKMGGGDVAFLSWIAEEDKKASEIV